VDFFLGIIGSIIGSVIREFLWDHVLTAIGELYLGLKFKDENTIRKELARNYRRSYSHAGWVLVSTCLLWVAAIWIIGSIVEDVLDHI
jgi:hypothetical protein